MPVATSRSTSVSREVSGEPAVDLRRRRVVEEAGERAEQLALIVLPRHVRVAARAGRSARSAAATRARGRARSARCGRRGDAGRAPARRPGRDVAQVGVEVELEEDRRRLGGRSLALHARVLLELVAARVRVEEAREHLRGEPPVDPRELDERRRASPRGCRCGSRTRRRRRSARPCSGSRIASCDAARQQHEDAKIAARPPTASITASSWRLSDSIVGRGSSTPVAEPAAEPVEADDLVRARELEVERPLVGVRPLLFEVRDPARADEERRPVAVGRIGEPATVEVEVPDLLLHGYTA